MSIVCLLCVGGWYHTDVLHRMLCSPVRAAASQDFDLNHIALFAKARQLRRAEGVDDAATNRCRTLPAQNCNKNWSHAAEEGVSDCMQTFSCFACAIMLSFYLCLDRCAACEIKCGTNRCQVLISPAQCLDAAHVQWRSSCELLVRMATISWLSTVDVRIQPTSKVSGQAQNRLLSECTVEKNELQYTLYGPP